MYIAASSGDFITAGLTGGLIRLGDLSLFTTPISLVICINHPVGQVGVFFPALEEPADVLNPVATQWSQVDTAVYSLLQAASQAAGGAATDVPVGTVRPCIPGTGFGLLEVRNGS
jgi:hypothetical protein